MNIECGDCKDFVELTERSYGKILERYGFRPLKCSSEHDGRECRLMLESDRLRLLFMRSDGSETCELGSLEAEFPVGGFDFHGDSGWYNMLTLLEFKTGKKLLTRRRLDKFRENKPEYYAWQAEVLSENAEKLFDLFRVGNEKTWKNEFLKFFKAMLKG
jgi:hypothetical protein